MNNFFLSYVPPSPNRLDEDISEIMQKEGSDNDSQTGEEENEHQAKRMRHDDQVWDSSEMFLVETPVSFLKKMSAQVSKLSFFSTEQNACIRFWGDLLATKHNARGFG